MIRTSSSRLRWATLLAVALATTGGAVERAHADPTPAAIASAKSLVADGRKLRDAGDTKGARDKFRAAYALVPTPIIGLDLGKADVALGELVAA